MKTPPSAAPRSDGGNAPPNAKMPTTSETWTPLREDYFDTPLLSARDTRYLVRKSCEAAQEVVERARCSQGPMQWRHVEKYQNVQIYAGFARGTYDSEPTSMCGVTSVAGTVAEVATLFDMSTTRAMKSFAEQYPELFYDAVVLYTLSPRTKEKPMHQVTAKWMAMRCPKNVSDRDFCFLECQDRFVDSTGRKGWVLCMHSIKLPGCEDLSREFGFVRGSFYHSGLVVVESDRPGFVDIIHMLQINLKNNTRMPPAMLRERIAFVSRVSKMLKQKRINEQHYLSDLELVPKKYRSRCHVCQDSFGMLLLRKLNCRKCGEVVCAACSREFEITSARFLEPLNLRICMQCFQSISSGRATPAGLINVPRLASTVSLLGFYEDNQLASSITLPSTAHRGEQDFEPPPKIYLQTMRARRKHSSRHADWSPSPQDADENYDQFANYPGERGQRMTEMPRQAQYAGYPSGFDGADAFDPTPKLPPRSAPPQAIFDRRGKPPGRRQSTPVPMMRPNERISNIAYPAPPNEGRMTFQMPSTAREAVPPQSRRKPRPSSTPFDVKPTALSTISSQSGSVDLDPDSQPRDAMAHSTSRSVAANNGNARPDAVGAVPSYRHRDPTGKTSRSYFEDEEEEKKTPEFSDTPALVAPGASAQASTHEALRPSSITTDSAFEASPAHFSQRREANGNAMKPAARSQQPGAESTAQQYVMAQGDASRATIQLGFGNGSIMRSSSLEDLPIHRNPSVEPGRVRPNSLPRDVPSSRAPPYPGKEVEKEPSPRVPVENKSSDASVSSPAATINLIDETTNHVLTSSMSSKSTISVASKDKPEVLTDEKHQFSDSESDGEEKSDNEKSEDDTLQSARTLFARFGSHKRLVNLVGGIDNEPSFNRTIEQIQEGFDALSVSSDGGDDDDARLAVERTV